MSADTHAGSADQAAMARKSSIHSPAADRWPTQPAVAQQDRVGDHAVKPVSYTLPTQPDDSSSSDAEMIRTALNTGYGNLFPVISPEDYYRTQRETANSYNTTDARNAYYEQFGRPGSSTPHVIHASMSRQVPNEADSGAPNRSSELRAQNASYNGTSRIQSPNYQSDRQDASDAALPANSFPVTKSLGQNPTAPNYSQFPRQEQPPFANSTVSQPMTDNIGSEQPGTLVREYGADQVSPMSEQDRKAHELALERYRRSQQ